jgi:hypothetical protein
MKAMITPGRLYYLMSAEFRQMRCSDCTNCSLPLPQHVDSEETSWALEKWTRDCEKCARLISQLVRKYQAKYDLMDPFSRPVPGRRKPPPAIHPFH